MLLIFMFNIFDLDGFYVVFIDSQCDLSDEQVDLLFVKFVLILVNYIGDWVVFDEVLVLV